MPTAEEPNPPGTASLRILLGMQSSQKHIRLDVPPSTTTLDIKKKISEMVEPHRRRAYSRPQEVD